MDQRKVDFIVVGQGIAGTWLSFELIKRGYNILVFNQETPNTSSLKAAGLYNPVTGKKMVKTWLADELFKELETNYQELEELLDTRFLHPTPLYRPFQSFEERNEWEIKADDSGYSDYIAEIKGASMGLEGIQDDFGGIVLNKAGYVDLKVLIPAYRSYLKDKGLYLPEMFDYKELAFVGDRIQYKDITAKRILFCEGPSLSNPYWKNLPYKHVRGELFDMECELKSDHIINRGVFMIPKKNHFTVGSTYDHNDLSFEPKEEGISLLRTKLSKLYVGDYRIVNKSAGVRPATKDRKPFVGLHPNMPTLGIFNGFGTKGVSLTPYFAEQLVNAIEGNGKIETEADVKRTF